MTEYLFVLGRNHELSFLELVSYLKKEGIQHNLKQEEELILADLRGFNPKKAMRHLGGIVRIGEEIKR